MDANLGLDQDLINAVRGIVEASCSAKKMEKEELHPNQKVLDKNKNGKLDADDFKKLRKEEEEVEGFDEASIVGQAKHLVKGIKRAVAGKPSAAASEKDADTIGEEFTLEDFDLEELQDFMMSEDFEQLDELSKNTLGSYVKKASDESGLVRTVAGAFSQQAKSTKNAQEKDRLTKISDDSYKHAFKRQAGISKAVDKLTKEQVEEIEMLAAKHGLGE